MKTISRKAAEALFDDPRPFKLAILKHPFCGKFSRWRRGEKVKVRHSGNGSYSIERVKWKGSLVPLCNSMFGVPRSAFDFTDK